MVNFVIWRPFCFWKCVFFRNLFELSIWTSIQNLESIAQKMSEFCDLLYAFVSLFRYFFVISSQFCYFFTKITGVWKLNKKLCVPSLLDWRRKVEEFIEHYDLVEEFVDKFFVQLFDRVGHFKSRVDLSTVLRVIYAVLLEHKWF